MSATFNVVKTSYFSPCCGTTLVGVNESCICTSHNTMKRFQYLIALAILCSTFSCKQKQVGPTENGLSGTWILFQNRFWNGSAIVTQNIPSSPQRTLTFTATSDVLAKAIDDTTLSEARYFQATYSNLVGPQMLLRKSKDGSITGSLKYLLQQDTLEMSPMGLASFGYRFRRL